jgi:RNA polymerase sigma-70 factor (ECF subfamily)
VKADIEALWHEHHARILNWVQFKTHSDEAEDLTQTVYLRALQAIRNGNGPVEQVNGWLWRIAGNVVIDYYRWRGRLPDALELDADHRFDQNNMFHGRQEGEAEFLITPEPGPEELAMQGMEQQRVREAVQRLACANLTDTINLRLEGYTNGEIAEMFGASESAVKQYNTRAFVKLREWLREAA